MIQMSPPRLNTIESACAVAGASASAARAAAAVLRCIEGDVTAVAWSRESQLRSKEEKEYLAAETITAWEGGASILLPYTTLSRRTPRPLIAAAIDRDRLSVPGGRFW